MTSTLEMALISLANKLGKLADLWIEKLEKEKQEDG